MDSNAEEVESADDQYTELYALTGMLAFFSLTGTIGNALVIYVYSRQTQKLTSTSFILALAVMDFITCLVIIPYTIVMENLVFVIGNDVLCKLYHGLIATSVPFSTFTMVAIAVDRYLCICHPFTNAMTTTRAKISIGILAIAAISLGVLASLYYGVNTNTPSIVYGFNATINANSDFLNNVFLNNTGSAHVTISQSSSATISYSTFVPYQNNTVTMATCHGEKCYYSNAGVCNNTYLIMSTESLSIYQRVYSSLFLVAIVMVAVLYSLIYRSVVARREQSLRTLSNCCQRTFASPANGNLDSDDSDIDEKQGINQGEVKVKRFRTCSVKKNAWMTASYRAKLERNSIANLKTAVMLFVVTVVFIVTFLPAWLMALKMLGLNLVVFYLYFTYNVANPIIYAFMNPKFRKQLRKIVKC